MANVTTLGEAQATTSPHDVILVELIEPEGLPAYVQVTWPRQATVVDPDSFGEPAAAIVKLFSTSHVRLARIRSRRHR